MPNRLADKRESEKPEEKVRKHSNEYLKYSGMAFEMFAIMGIFVFVGTKLDERLQNEKGWFTILGAILGTIVALVYTLRDFLFNKEK